MLPGSKLYFYATGTSTPQDTYSTSALVTPNSNPVIADSNGLFGAIYLNASLQYKMTLTTSADVLVYTVDPVNDQILTQSIIGALLYPRTSEEIAAGITPTNYAYQSRNMLRYGAVADGATDNTTLLLTVGNAMGGVLLIPQNIKYSRATLLATLDTDVLFDDESGINSFSDPGQTSKRIGQISRDTSANDSAKFIESGHHAGISMNNHGTAGTGSAALGVASRDIMRGTFALPGSSKDGDRFWCGDQYQKHPVGNYWIWIMPSYAPWAAVGGAYEYWAAAQVISGAGVYRVFGSNVYVSAGAGTTALPAPVNTTGTAPDGGGVQWTWIYSVGTSILTLDEYGRMLVGTNNSGAQFEGQTSVTDPSGGDYAMVLRPVGVSKKSTLKGFATTAGSAQSAQPYFQWQDTIGLRAMRSSGSGSVWRFTDTGVLVEDTVSDSRVNVANADATPSVLGSRWFFISNSGATNITALDDGVDGQEVEFFTDNGNTTFVSSASLLLQGSANVTLTAYSVIKFRKVPNAISNRWIEVSRSIK